MLGKLVVHLQANYRHLTAGLSAARSDVVSAVSGIQAAVGGIASGGNAFGGLEAQADQVSGSLHRVANAAHGVETAMETTAFTAEVTATSFARVGSVVATVGSGVGFFGRVLTFASGMLRMVAGAAHLVGAAFAAIANVVRSAAGAVMHVIHSIHAASIVFRLLSTAVRIVLWPVQMLISAFMMLARFLGAVVKPIFAIYMAVLRVWFVLRGFGSTLKIIYSWLGMLPPKLRLLVVGMLALGATGRAGALALRVLGFGFRVAATGVQLLLLPIQLIRNPMLALVSAANLLGKALRSAGSIARSAGTSFLALGRSVGSAVGRVAGSIGGVLVGAAKAAGSALAVAGVAVAAWGVKLAAKAETGAVVLGTMLKNMAAGKALQRDLENWSGAPLFDPDSIQLSGVLLFKAGVAADQIVGKLDQLGQIAVATKTPVEDLSRIYQQGMNRGAFQQDLVNQMSDRGIAIYEGLAHATGKSGLALKELISDGKIGPAEMNAALAHLTEGQGIYAGAIANVGQTTEGMWKTLQNKVSFAAREIGINLLQAFDFKSMMASGIEFVSNLRGEITNAMPVFMAIASVVKAAFGAVWEVVSVTFAMITGALGLTGGSFMQTFLEWAAIATWCFKQWPDIATLAFINVGLALVRFGADFAHIFTGVMPALFSWFGKNWSQLFMTAASFVGTVFTNIGKNIMDTMKAVWDYIASGGTKTLSVAWTPLLDGFKNTVAALPDIPPRAIGQLEQQLAADSAQLAEALGGSLAAEIDANMKMLADFQAAQASAVAPTLDGSGHGDETPSDPNAAGDSAVAKAKAVENKAIETRSAEGQQSLATLFGTQRENAAKAGVTEQKKTNVLLDKLERNTRAPKIRGAAFSR